MFDNLRDSTPPFYEEEQNDLYTEEPRAKSAAPRRRRKTRFLGLTAQQRFILSMMLMFMVCIMGALAMFVTGRMTLF